MKHLFCSERGVDSSPIRPLCLPTPKKPLAMEQAGAAVQRCAQPAAP